MADIADNATLEEIDRLATEQREERRLEGFKYPQFLLEDENNQPFILKVEGAGKNGEDRYFALAVERDQQNSSFILLERNKIAGEWLNNIWDTPNQFENTGEAVYQHRDTGTKIPADKITEITVKIQENGSAVIVPDTDFGRDYWTHAPNNPADDVYINSYDAEPIKLGHEAAVEDAKKYGNQTLVAELGEFPKNPENGELRFVKVALVQSEGLDLSVGNVLSADELQQHLLDKNNFVLTTNFVQTNTATQPTQNDEISLRAEAEQARRTLELLDKRGVGTPSASVNANYNFAEARMTFANGSTVTFNPVANANTISAPVANKPEVKEVKPLATDAKADPRYAAIAQLQPMVDALPAGHPARINLERDLNEMKVQLGLLDPQEIEPKVVEVKKPTTEERIETRGAEAKSRLPADYATAYVDGVKQYAPEPEYENKPDSSEFFEALPGMMNQLVEETVAQKREEMKTLDPNSSQYKDMERVLGTPPKTVTAEDVNQNLRGAQERVNAEISKLKGDAQGNGHPYALDDTHVVHTAFAPFGAGDAEFLIVRDTEKWEEIRDKKLELIDSRPAGLSTNSPEYREYIQASENLDKEFGEVYTVYMKGADGGLEKLDAELGNVYRGSIELKTDDFEFTIRNSNTNELTQVDDFYTRTESGMKAIGFDEGSIQAHIKDNEFLKTSPDYEERKYSKEVDMTTNRNTSMLRQVERLYQSEPQANSQVQTLSVSDIAALHKADPEIQNKLTETYNKLAGPQMDAMGISPEVQEMQKRAIVEQAMAGLKAIADGEPVEQVIDNTSFSVSNAAGVDADEFKAVNVEKMNEMARQMIVEAAPLIEQQIQADKARADSICETNPAAANTPYCQNPDNYGSFKMPGQ